MKSATSGKSTSRADKHCNIGKCNGKLIVGKNWAIHYKKTHRYKESDIVPSSYAICTGVDCKQCSKDETKSAATHKDDIHRSFYKCSKCSKEKRSDYISSRDPVVVCKVCAKKEEPKKKEPKKKAPATKKRQRSPSSSLSSVTDNDDDGDMIKQQPPRLSQSVLDKLPEKTGVEEQDIVMDE